MAASTQMSKAGAIPAPILAARKKLEELGLEVNPENLKKHLDAAELNKAAGALRSALKGKSENSTYRAGTTVEKREWLARYVLDPDVASCFARYSLERVESDGTRSKKLWLTINQMASPMFFNSMEDAELVAKDLPSRDHELESMRAAGRKEYHLTLTEEMFERWTKEKVGVAGEAGMKAEDFKKVRGSLKGKENGPSRKAAKLAIEDMSPEQKAAHEAAEERRGAISGYKASLANMKKQADKTKQEVDNLRTCASNLKNKGYPIQMQEYFVGFIDPVATEGVALMTRWSQAALVEVGNKSPQELSDMKLSFEEATQSLEASLKDLVQKKGKELRNIVK